MFDGIGKVSIYSPPPTGSAVAGDTASSNHLLSLQRTWRLGSARKRPSASRYGRDCAHPAPLPWPDGCPDHERRRAPLCCLTPSWLLYAKRARGFRPRPETVAHQMVAEAARSPKFGDSSRKLQREFEEREPRRNYRLSASRRCSPMHANGIGKGKMPFLLHSCRSSFATDTRRSRWYSVRQLAASPGEGGPGRCARSAR